MSHPPMLDVVCLCADWCGTCREYQALFDALQDAMPSHRYRWIDIEDQADMIGDIDVETFPTLLIAHAGTVRFAGPVLPRLGDATRLMASLLAQIEAGDAAPSPTALGLDLAQATAFAALATQLAAAH